MATKTVKKDHRLNDRITAELHDLFEDIKEITGASRSCVIEDSVRQYVRSRPDLAHLSPIPKKEMNGQEDK